MRALLVSSLLMLLACGGAAQKPADSPPEDKSSPAESSASSSADMPGASSTGESSSHAAAASPASSSASASSSPSPSAPAAAVHPVPAVTGSIDGKPFAPKVARIAGPMQKDGRILLALDENTDCASAGGPTLTMMVPWQNGYKADLGSLKRATKKAPGEITFSRVAGSKKDVSATFKPSGTVTIVSAPMTKDATGKMKIDLQSGDYMLAGDLDIQVCVSPAK